MVAATAMSTVTATTTATANFKAATPPPTRRLLRRSYLGRAAAGEPPSCVPHYCCVDEKG